MVRIRYLIILTAFVSMIAIPIPRAQTASGDTQSSTPVAEQPVQEPAQYPQAAPSETPPQLPNAVAQPEQQPAQTQAAPSQTAPQLPNATAQPEESTPEQQVQQPAQTQEAPNETSPQAPSAAAEQPEQSTPKPEKHRTQAEYKAKRKPLRPSATANPVLWAMPNDIAAKNLLWGQGGQQRQPQPPFTFLAEDRNGTSPKCDVRDANHERWRVKLGAESRPEVVASRLLWAVGYYVNDDYVLPKAQISGLKMKRKSDKMHGTEVIDARFARKPGSQKKIGSWKWGDNPFVGTRGFNGLRVMMAVMNNWDLKDSNNAVYADRKDGTQIYLASDIGASFGANRFEFSRTHAKGNLDSYKGSKFITHASATEVDFGTPSPPVSPLAMAVGVGEIMYASRATLDWIGKNIPIEDARWMGSVLGQLSHQQLVDAFRAGNFPPDEVDGYVQVLESRIAELKGL